MEEVRKNFQNFERNGWFIPGSGITYEFPINHEGGQKGYREAAVLFLISHHHDKLQVLLTKRSTTLSTHQGQECLPGGIRDVTDSSLVETALREAEEEVGLERTHVEVVCASPPHIAYPEKLCIVTPIIALTKLPPHDLRLVSNPAEVDCMYWVPLEEFLGTGYVITDTNMLYRSIWKNVGFDYIDPETRRQHNIWGLTASICITLSAIALNRSPVFPLFMVRSLFREEKVMAVLFSQLLGQDGMVECKL